MADDELQAIRARRMQQLRQSNQISQQNPEELARRQAEQDIMKNSILTQALDQNALARLSNLQLAKPDKAKAIETMIINMARSGHIRGKMSDEQFRKVLDDISERTTKTTTVKFDRRKAAIDSDSE